MFFRLLVVGVLLSLSGCGCEENSGQPCDGDDDCPSGQLCIDDRCAPPLDAGEVESGDSNLCPSGQPVCGSACCGDAEVCRFDSCVSDFGECIGNDDCWGDSYCSDGRCVPYGVPSDFDHDESCQRDIDIEAIEPAVQCRWTGPPEGDAHPERIHVMATPVVVDFDLDDDASTLSPSIVFPTFPTTGSYREPGVLRIIDGETCEQQFSFDAAEDQVMSPASAAVGDLDGDGRAEIVAVGHIGGLKAFRYVPERGAFERIWTSAACDETGERTPDTTGGADEWGGPSIHDLDDDGVPEIIYGATVYGTDGCIIADSLTYPRYSQGVVPVLADVDEDGTIELVGGNGVWEFDPDARIWTLESYVTTGGALGQVAVADMGEFPVETLDGRDLPEVVVVSNGMARVQTIDGAVVFGPVAIPEGGRGGAPTVADFDGDGRREFASAGGGAYVVFDLDCVPEGVCDSARTDGILWTRPSQDNSSNVTGSSVFDFDADGAAEVIYADECFLRIYDGKEGEVVYSAARSSGTTYENPVIVDVDGDFHSEIVSSVNDYAGSLGCPSTDPLRSSTAFERNHGIVVLRDVLDRWASSRPVWNQHAYAVTHVGDRGESPRSSAVDRNWSAAGLNNFRQNVQGDLDPRGFADLTAASEEGPLRVLCDGEGVATLPAQICNRGTLPLAAGTEIAFRVGAPDGEELCRAPVPVALTVGMCTEVTCTGPLPTESVDLYVEVDPDDDERECWEGNNFALLRDVRCQSVD